LKGANCHCHTLLWVLSEFYTTIWNITQFLLLDDMAPEICAPLI
jgi:hypothetical protein